LREVNLLFFRERKGGKRKQNKHHAWYGRGLLLTKTKAKQRVFWLSAKRLNKKPRQKDKKESQAKFIKFFEGVWGNLLQKVSSINYNHV